MIDGYRGRPLYSADNEDTRSELEALEIGGDDTVIAIAAGGGRALSLLAAAPRRLVALDRRADQVFNLELKAAALEAFDYEAFLGFLGIADDPGRLDRYRALRPALSRGARRYWDCRRRLVRAGVFYAGRTEGALLRFTRHLRDRGLMRWADPFFRATSVEAQRVLLAAHRARVDRGLVWWRLFCHPLLIYPMTQDPGFLRSTQGSVGAYLARRLVGYASRNLVRESYLLRLVYDGGVGPASPLPPYLTPTGFERARKHLDRLEVQCGDLRDFAARSRLAGVLKWSLSDLSCWMTERQYHDLLRLVVQRGETGSRLCARNFAASREIPRDLRKWVRRLDALCDRLDATDASAIYRFEAAEYPRIH